MINDYTKLAEKIYGKTHNDVVKSDAEGARDDSRVLFPGDTVTPEDALAVSPERYAVSVEEKPEVDAAVPVRPTEEELRYAIPFTRAGEESAKWYADRYVETGDARYVVGGVLASLWTPETAGQTLQVLMSALQKSGYENRAYTRYTGAKSLPEDTWGTRGPFWEPPYGADYARAKDALQIPNEVTGHHQFKPRWYELMRGPRKVEGNPDYGAGGGVEYYKGWQWPKNRTKGTD